MRPYSLFKIRRPIYILIIVNILFFTLLSLHIKPLDPSILIAGGGVIVLMVTSYIIIVKKQMGDQYIFLIMSMLVSLGIIMLYRLNPDYGFAQIKWYGLGIVLYFMSYILFQVIKNWDRYIYAYIAGSMLLFLITFTLGVSIKGSINWVRIGDFSFQPAEATKIFFVFFIAAYYKLRLSSDEALISPGHNAILSDNSTVPELQSQKQVHSNYDISDESKSGDKVGSGDEAKPGDGTKSGDKVKPGFEETEISIENKVVSSENSTNAMSSQLDDSNSISFQSDNHIKAGFSLRDFFKKCKTSDYRELIRNKQIIKNKYVFLAIIYLHLFLLLAQRELGMTILFYVVFISIFYIYEKDYRLLFYNIGALAVILVLSYFTLAHVRVRLTTWIDPWDQISGKGYQITQSLFAIAAGGFFGTGLGLGNPDYIPVVHTDFIFSAICEEMGLFGGMAVVLLYFILIYRGFKIALTIKETFKKIVALGITLIYGYQTFIIIGGVIKLIPLTGITLPFISYGGSSLISAFMAFGILQAISGGDSWVDA